jgi:hypothetical protein
MGGHRDRIVNPYSINFDQEGSPSTPGHAPFTPHQK